MYTSTKKPISYSIDNKNKPYNIQYKLEYDQKVFLKSILKLPTAELETMSITFKLITRIVEILNRDRYRDYDLEMLNNLRNQYILREKLKRDLNILFTVTLDIENDFINRYRKPI